ncbi:MAG: helix-turn-helix transcriptional regulator [Planctomycetes bacterium]|nr:helix-turn-helix transcriptional regulator [Planctomycetota bacterium]
MEATRMSIEEITDEYIGSRIRKARKLLEMNRKAFSALVNMTYDTVVGIEKGKGITAARLFQIAKASGQPIRFFAGEEGSTDPNPGQLDFKQSQRISVSKEDLGDRLGLACN